MPFSSIFGHQGVITRLCDAALRDHLPTAYLFSGPNGVGKGVVARALAQMLNCQARNNCGKCQSCQLFLRGSHPDLLVVEPVGSKFIRIGQIQELIQALALKPVYAQTRVVILKHAQEMNLEAANAFLKILEEPPLDTLFILTALDRHQLLETIRSRCAQVPFAALEQPQVLAILQAKYRLAADAQALCLAYSFGRLRREFVEKAPKLLSLRAQALHMLAHLQPGEMEGHMHQLEALLQQNLEFFFLEFLGHLLKDLSLLQQGQGQVATNQDCLEELHPLAIRFEAEAIEQAFGAVIRCEEKLQSFAGRQLALEALLVELKRGLA